MNFALLIPPTALRDYAKEHGWSLLREVARERIYVMSNPRYDSRQIVFPRDTSAPDYEEAVELVIGKLASLEDRTPEEIVKSLLDVGDDGISFRVVTANHDESLPLTFAGSMLLGASQLLLASASTVLRPQIHHSRMSRSEAQQFLDSAKFRHTQSGSFVLNVSCPVQALDVQTSLMPEEESAPFVRRATVTLVRSLRDLVSAIEDDSLDTFVDTVKSDSSPNISSNFCEALTRFEDPSMKNSVEIAVAWASSIPRPANESQSVRVRIQHDYFSRIGEVSRALRPTTQHTEDTFPATVERLDGEMSENGKRVGEVILSLLTREGEQVRARAHLTADQYEQADIAPMKDGAFVTVTGKLHPGRQPRQLSDIKAFALMTSVN